MSFEVIKPGVLSLIQDKGRFGYQNIGITNGGPMDEYAFYWANYLLGNEINAPQIEITYGMLELIVHKEACISITGADLGAQINDMPIYPWKTYLVNEGDKIIFNKPSAGLRAYLAVRGGLNVCSVLGSCSTVIREEIGGLNGIGKKLSQGDKIEFDSNQSYIDQAVPSELIPDYSAELRLGVILGYQYESFSKLELSKFFSCTYEISKNIDRMGYRLSGDPIKSKLNGIISEGIALGSIQVPADGQPIVLMRDRQTIGGYPKIGCLSSLGVSQLSQRGVGEKISFYPTDVANAEAERMIFEHRFSQI